MTDYMITLETTLWGYTWTTVVEVLARSEEAALRHVTASLPVDSEYRVKSLSYHFNKEALPL